MQGGNTGWLRFSTDTLPEHERFPYFCEEIVRCQVGLDAVKPKDLTFNGAIDLYRAGAVDITHVVTSPAHYERTRALVRDGRDTIFAVFCLEGTMRSTQGSEHYRIDPGDVVLCDSTETGGLYMETATRYWAVGVPRTALATLGIQVERCAGMRLSNRNLPLSLLATYLDSLHRREAGHDEAPRIFGQHLLDLLGLALGATHNSEQCAEGRGLRTARRVALLREIDAHACKEYLNANWLALRLGISPRYVHLLLEDTGQTLSQQILNKRLDNALALLRDERNFRMRISDIAGEVGFSDLSHFNRCFRRRFSDTPSSLRAAAVMKAMRSEDKPEV